MSEESALKLKKASEQLLAAEQELKSRKDEFLAAVAAQIPGHMTALAKTTAFDQPKVTKALGRDGVREFRESLENLATQASEDVAGAALLIQWWPATSIHSKPSSHEVHASVRDYLRNKVAENFVNAFRSSGFEFAGTNPVQVLVSTQSFYTEDDTAAEARALCEAMLAYAKAEDAVEKAQKADDDAAVSELWGD